MRRIKALIACERSKVVRNAFNSYRGVDAICCDVLPPEDGDLDDCYYMGDVRDLLKDKWDVMIAFPPCTYLCSSGLHWNKRRPERALETEKALEFVRFLLDAPIPHIMLENPVGCISTRIRKYDQKIQPYQFGEDASKATCLWLKNLPLLSPTKYIAPRIVNGKKRWGNQTDSGQNKLAPSDTRWMERSRTLPGIGNAIAEQVVKFLVENKS